MFDMSEKDYHQAIEDALDYIQPKGNNYYKLFKSQMTKGYYKSLYGFEIELKLSYFSFEKLQ